MSTLILHALSNNNLLFCTYIMHTPYANITQDTGLQTYHLLSPIIQVVVQSCLHAALRHVTTDNCYPVRYAQSADPHHILQVAITASITKLLWAGKAEDASRRLQERKNIILYKTVCAHVCAHVCTYVCICAPNSDQRMSVYEYAPQVHRYCWPGRETHQNFRNDGTRLLVHTSTLLAIK